MVNLVRAVIGGIGVGALLLAGCRSNKAEKGEARYPGEFPAEERAAGSEGMAHPSGAENGAGDAPRAIAFTVTAVQLDPSLAAACNIAAPHAFFEFESATVRDQATPTLDALAQCLTTGPLSERNIEITGHTDPRGTDEYNRQLGRSRADSVADYLAAKGVNKNKVAVKSMGEAMSSAKDERGWAYERRVDIRLIK